MAAESFRSNDRSPLKMTSIEIQPDELGAEPVSTGAPKTRRALSRLKRELSEEELGTTGVQKMLVAEVERLDEENGALVEFRDKYYDLKADLAVAKQKENQGQAAEVISSACIALGGAALGYVPAVWGNQRLSAVLAIVIGLVLIVAAIVAKVVRR